MWKESDLEGIGTEWVYVYIENGEGCEAVAEWTAERPKATSEAACRMSPVSQASE